MSQSSIQESDAKHTVMDIVVGQWRSQTLYAGMNLEVFSTVDTEPKRTTEITDELDIDSELGYRLLRALGALGLLEETADSAASAPGWPPASSANYRRRFPSLVRQRDR